MRSIEAILADCAKHPIHSTTYTERNQAQIVIRANQMAREASMDTLMRELGAAICGGDCNIQRDGYRRIALWIRKNCRYVQESYGIEKLQGPYSTLRSRVMDCDDGAILWATLCRAIGLNAVAVGIGTAPEQLGHMVGMNADTGRLYELSTGEGYGTMRSDGPDALLLDQGKWWLETSHDGQTITGWSAEVKKQGHTIPVGVALVSGAAFALIGMREGDHMAEAFKRFAVGAGIALVGGMLISTQLDETIHE
jgi:hypothetical protein